MSVGAMAQGKLQYAKMGWPGVLLRTRENEIEEPHPHLGTERLIHRRWIC